MELRTEHRESTDEDGLPLDKKGRFVEPELVQRGTLPQITWFAFSGVVDDKYPQDRG